jgi:PKD repeat protein
MGQSSRWERAVISILSVLFVATVSAKADDQERTRLVADRPVREFVSAVVFSNLGPATLENGTVVLNRLRIANPTPFAATARVAGTRIDLAPMAILERADLLDTAIVQSNEELHVTSRLSDASDTDALNATQDSQLAGRDLHVASQNAVTQSCPATVVLSTNSVACKYGTSAAYVEPVTGATYVWTAQNTSITSGQGTNMVFFAHGGDPTASVAVTITANGCTSTGAATITLIDPFTISTFYASPTSVPLGSPVTLTWAISGTYVPKTQTLKINGTAVVVKTADRAYTFTPSAKGAYTAVLYDSLIGGRVRGVRHGGSPIPSASFCGADTRSVSFTVTDPCNAPSATVSAPDSVAPSATFSASMPFGAASYSWNVTNGTILSGQGTNVVSVRAGSSGSVSLSGTASNGSGCSASSSATVAIVCPAASGTASVGSSVNQGSSLSGSVSTTGSWTVTSALGNAVSPSSGNGSTSFTYTGTNAGNDTLTFTFTNACGSTVQRTANITVSVVIPAPTASISANPTSINFGQTSTLTFTVANATSWQLSRTSGNHFAGGSSGTTSGTFTRTYDADTSTGVDTITLTVTGPGGTATATCTITVGDPAPVVTNFTISKNPVPLGTTASVSFTIANGTSWHIASALGNGFSQNNVSGSGAFTIGYSAANGAGAETLTLTVTGPGGTTTAKLTFTVS